MQNETTKTGKQQNSLGSESQHRQGDHGMPGRRLLAGLGAEGAAGAAEGALGEGGRRQAGVGGHGSPDPPPSLGLCPLW